MMNHRTRSSRDSRVATFQAASTVTPRNASASVSYTYMELKEVKSGVV